MIYILYIYTVYICIFIWYTPCFDHGAYVCFYRFSQAVAFGVCCPHPGRMNFSTVMNSLPQRCPKKRHEKHKKPLDCSLVGGLFPLPPVFHFFKKNRSIFLTFSVSWFPCIIDCWWPAELTKTCLVTGPRDPWRWLKSFRSTQHGFDAAVTMGLLSHWSSMTTGWWLGVCPCPMT